MSVKPNKRNGRVARERRREAAQARQDAKDPAKKLIKNIFTDPGKTDVSVS